MHALQTQRTSQLNTRHVRRAMTTLEGPIRPKHRKRFACRSSLAVCALGGLIYACTTPLLPMALCVAGVLAGGLIIGNAITPHRTEHVTYHRPARATCVHVHISQQYQ